jgi:hypothetical protein
MLSLPLPLPVRQTTPAPLDPSGPGSGPSRFLYGTGFARCPRGTKKLRLQRRSNDEEPISIQRRWFSDTRQPCGCLRHLPSVRQQFFETLLWMCG